MVVRARACVIAGGGVAGLETLLALRALAGDRVDITLVTPELRFVNRSMAVDQPFRTTAPRGVRLEASRRSTTRAGIAARSIASNASDASSSPGTATSWPTTCSSSPWELDPSANGTPTAC